MSQVHDQLEALCHDQGTAQLSISKRGEVCFNSSHYDAPVDVYAVQKGIVSLLVGIAETRYFLERYDAMNHILDPEWTQLEKPDEAALTVETLLNMTTGMDDELRLNGVIGEEWRYNNVAFQALKKALEIQTGETLSDITHTWLLDPLTIKDTHWRDRPPDHNGRVFSALFSTAPSLRQIGEALLRDELIDPEYKAALTTPSSTTNPAWHLGWWNNCSEHYRLPGKDGTFKGPLLPHAPRDLISARGFGGHHLSISPDRGWVIAQTISPDQPRKSHTDTDPHFWQLIEAL